MFCDPIAAIFSEQITLKLERLEGVQLDRLEGVQLDRLEGVQMDRMKVV